uniref:ARAD1D08228p n=1 Tax=Blastobotrys adeninivorans TaxID=409370 RepID=A0A060TDM2_BLAAD
MDRKRQRVSWGQSRSLADRIDTMGRQGQGKSSLAERIDRKERKVQGKNESTGEDPQLHSKYKPTHPREAQHPVTTSVYICNLHRPIAIAVFRARLEKIAQEEVTLFWISKLRTHCFVTLPSTEAAARVRDTFHNSGYPDRDSPTKLFADYIPPEKIQGWIAEESEQAKAQKRWAVRYSKVPNGIVAEHYPVFENNESRTSKDLHISPGIKFTQFNPPIEYEEAPKSLIQRRLQRMDRQRPPRRKDKVVTTTTKAGTM